MRTVPEDEHYARRPDVELREMDGSVFLADNSSDSIYYLNQTGAAIWHFLNAPATLRNTIATLQAAFPGASDLQIEKDVRDLFRRMIERRLIVPLESRRR